MQLHHTGTVDLETNRLSLRKIEFNDIYKVYEWKKDPEVSKNMSWSAVKSLIEVGAYIEYWLENYQKNNEFYLWGIALKETNDLIGRIKIVSINNTSLAGELDYCLSKSFWGKGYASEAAKKIISYAFESIGFNRMYAEHIIGNNDSGNVMKKCGMQYEGLLRQNLKNDIGFFDCKLYSILKQDYRKLVINEKE